MNCRREVELNGRLAPDVYLSVEPVRLDGADTVVAAPPADKRNTEQVSERHPPAILTPPEWGVVLATTIVAVISVNQIIGPIAC